MEKIKKAINIFDELNLESDIIRSATYVNWRSFENGASDPTKNTHEPFMYHLSNLTYDFDKKFKEAFDLLSEGIREIDSKDY